jgi:hypothetical protein
VFLALIAEADDSTLEEASLEARHKKEAIRYFHSKILK